MKVVRAFLVVLGSCVAAGTAAAQTLECAATGERDAASLSGSLAEGQDLALAFGPGYALTLTPATHGWTLAVRDGGGVDLSQITPPLHGPNPREIYGWHFRNSDNTGPNEGSINAPQYLRLFVFSPGLSGTAGIKPSGEITPDDVTDAEGRGWLRIGEFALAGLDAGDQARMTFLSFDACVTWSAGLEEPGSTGNEVTPELLEQFAACGLGTDHKLLPYLNAASLGGDFDGDGSLDVAAPIARAGDGKRAIAICRAGTWLDLVGLEGEMGELLPAYFDHIDWWGLHPASESVGVGATGEPAPTLQGDAILIGKDDSSSTLFFWTPEGYASYWQGD